MTRRIVLVFFLMLFAFQSTAPAGDDAEGSRDHPVLSRFPDSRIVFYDRLRHDQYKLGLGPWDHRRGAFEESRLIEGGLTRILYFIPGDYSPYEIFKNYEAALKRSDFEILFSGAGDELGRYGNAMVAGASFQGGTAKSIRRGDIGYHVEGASDQRYLAARATVDGEELYLSVFVGGGSMHRAAPLALVTVVECRDMKDDRITVNTTWEKQEEERLVLDRKEPETSRDHPLISRFPGSRICYYSELEHDEFELGLGRWDHRQEKFEQSRLLEGRLTRILYFVPRDRSPREIFGNYEAALKRSDFEILFSGTGDELGRYGQAMYKNGYFDGGTASSIRKGDIGHYLSGTSDQHYLAAKMTARGTDIYISVFVGGGSIHTADPLALITVVECKTMVDDLVSAGDLLEQIEMTGKALVYGIYFDTNCDLVKPESDAMLKEIAVLLKENPGLNLYIAGHTDDRGAFDYNMNLSARRAKSVVDRLVDKYDVATARLKAVGVGPAAPESTNETESGRAANRRVELVKRLIN